MDDMHSLTATFTLGGMNWTMWPDDAKGHEEGLTVHFQYPTRMTTQEAFEALASDLMAEKVQWLALDRGRWILRPSLFPPEFRGLTGLSWVKDGAVIVPEVDDNIEATYDGIARRTSITFVVTREHIELNLPKKIFLSHKGVDKPLVRDYHATLDALGFEPWLDEDAMPAGVELERGLLQGFQESCAAVFFITPSFKDETYLRTEINYALHQWRTKGPRFAIITLVFHDEGGTLGQVPDILKPYVWKEVQTQLEGLREMMRAFPIKITDNIEWKT